MPQPRTVVVTIPEMINDGDLAPLRELSVVDYHEVEKLSEDELAALVAGYDYLMLNYDVVKTLSGDFYRREPVRALKAISVDITGMDWASPQVAAENDVRLLNIPHYSTESVAETILAETLLHSRQRHLAYVDEIKGRPIEGRKGINLTGRRAAIIGLGSIGSRTAELLSGVGMEVVGWTRSGLATQLTLAEIFSSAAVICVCCKTVREGAETNVGFVGRELLMRCNGAIVINLANVDLVDHDAMADAIRDGCVSAYTVERNDKLIDSPLAGMEQVHFPPSNSWFSEESLQMLRHVWVRNVVGAINDEFPNTVAG
jgi:glycerate dehydrogenase